MKKTTVQKNVVCEICGELIEAGTEALERHDYDWDNPDEDLQGSVQISFFRHMDKNVCQKWVKALKLKAEIDATWEEDQFRKADH